MDFSGRLGTFYDRAAVLTTIPGDSAFHRCNLLELVALIAGGFKTFWTKAVAHFLRRDGQVAVPAPQCLVPFRQQLERGVITGSHVWHGNNRTNFQALNFRIVRWPSPRLCFGGALFSKITRQIWLCSSLFTQALGSLVVNTEDVGVDHDAIAVARTMESDIPVHDIAEDKFRIAIQGITVTTSCVHIQAHDVTALHVKLSGLRG